MNIQSRALLRIRYHEDDPFASHRRLRVQTRRPDSAAIPHIWQDKASEPVNDDLSAEARSQY